MNRLLYGASSLCLIVLGTNSMAQTSNTDSSSTMSKMFGDSGGISASVGVRLWGNQWDVPVFDAVPLANPQAPGGFVLQDTATSHLSSFKIGVIPFVGARMGNVIASVSYFIRTDYDAQTPRLNSVSRDELDVTLGYSILPASSDGSLVIALGYKKAKINSNVNPLLGQPFDASIRINAGLLGLSGSASLTDNLRLYGSAAYGFAKQETTPIPGQEPNDNLDGRYKVGEIGLNYAFYRGGEGQAFRNAAVALGYRAQVYTIKSFSLMTRSSTGVILATEKRDIDSTTQGPVLTFSASF